MLHTLPVPDRDSTVQIDTYALSDSESVFGTVDSFIYRCRNDRDYTMDFMSGRVAALCGRPADHILENRLTAFTDMVHLDDKESDICRGGRSD